MDPKWIERYGLIKVFAWFMLSGAICIVLGLCLRGTPGACIAVIGVLLFLPEFFYTYVVMLWHWKSRYRGAHSDLWGALLLLETSGWMKLVYLFRHMIPDMRGIGRYQRTYTEPPIPTQHFVSPPSTNLL